MFSVSDIVPLIINNLDIPSISSFRQLCKTADNIFNWSNYFLSKTTIPETYKEYSIDEKFMKEHGKYLINVTNPHIVSQWFKFYSRIKDTLLEYDKFMSNNCYKVLEINILYQEYKRCFIFNRRKEIVVLTIKTFTTIHTYNHSDKSIEQFRSIGATKLYKKLLIYGMHDINAILMQ